MRKRVLSTLRYSGAFVAILASASSCGVKDDIQQATEGCSEFDSGDTAVASLDVNAKVKAFAQASVELKQVSESIKGDVKAACVKIAVDLGERDTWSAESSDDSISNSSKTGACDVVAARIDAIMTSAAAAGADFALQISGGECTVNADVQTSCEESCKTDVMCSEPSVETRCAPAEITGQCDANCVGEATCEGRVEAAAECMGSCEAECEGTCSGELHGTTEGGCDGMCIGKCDGVKTPDGGMANCTGKCEGRCTQPKPTAMCHGKCSSSCHGKCKGQCKLEKDAAMNCGAGVSCKGGCSTAYVAPKCETELKPPVCTGDTQCQTNCAARASAAAECSPPTVTLLANADVSDDVAKLKATLEANLPNILLAAKTKGQLAVRAIKNVAATGDAVVEAAAKLSVKDVACAGSAASASVSAAASMSVSVNASVNVTSSCSAHSS
jgi:hypothetical protein